MTTIKGLSAEAEEIWRNADPEFWADIDGSLQIHEAPLRIERAFQQKLTTWSDGFERVGRGQFQFSIGERRNKEKIVFNFGWGKTGPGCTSTLNRWYEELQYLLRNERDVKMYKSTPYIPNTQDYQVWCQFIEVRQFGEPKQAYCVWNGDTIIASKAKPILRETAYDWTFDWRNAKTLQEMLDLVKDIK